MVSIRDCVAHLQRKIQFSYASLEWKWRKRRWRPVERTRPSSCLRLGNIVARVARNTRAHFDPPASEESSSGTHRHSRRCAGASDSSLGNAERMARAEFPAMRNAGYAMVEEGRQSRPARTIRDKPVRNEPLAESPPRRHQALQSRQSFAIGVRSAPAFDICLIANERRCFTQACCCISNDAFEDDACGLDTL